MKSKAISDKETFAAEAATSSNGIQRLSSLVLQLPNNAINPAFLLLSSVMACTDSPVVVMETVVLSAAAVGVVENAAVVVSANKHNGTRVTGVPSETATHTLDYSKGHIHRLVFVLLISIGGFSPAQGRTRKPVEELISNKSNKKQNAQRFR